MERIKEALEKARQSRKEKASDGLRVPTRIGETSASQKSLSQVEYDQTKVITLDPDILEQNRIVSHTKSDKRSAYFDILRTQVLQKMRAKGAKTLAITSPSPECGKSMISINLAYSIAQNSADSVLLVDFDLRRPSIARYLGIDVEPSLYDYLNGEETLENVLVNPGTPRLVILHNRRPIINASETLASQKVADFIKEVRERYPERVVIFDLPPLLNIDDAMVVLPNVDAALLVVAAGLSKPNEVRECRRLLKGHSLIGTVMNKSEATILEYY